MIIDFYIGRVLMNIDNVLEKMTFEDAMNELESIVNALDKGDISLDKAIAAYDRGSKLKDHCEKKLNEAKMKVETIQMSENQELILNKENSLNPE
jgi:exodeoxyribonuclease VII small subunit|tara:strand:- start:2169 stop:2453 length:285 start_codon:yes stop_codon:yes gene_type:complete